MQTGSAGQFQQFIEEKWSLGSVFGTIAFSNKKVAGGEDCAKLKTSFAHDKSLEEAYTDLQVPIGAPNTYRSLLDALWRVAKLNWDTPQPAGRRVAIVTVGGTVDYEGRQIHDGLSPFDPDVVDCEGHHFPEKGYVFNALKELMIHLIVLVPKDRLIYFQSFFQDFDRYVVLSIPEDTNNLLAHTMFTGINFLYCGTMPPTQKPEGSTASLPALCTQDAHLQLLHLQDISWSYTNDFSNMKAKFGDLLSALDAKFYEVEVALASFSDKPLHPGGYWIDYCYREDLVFGTEMFTFVDTLNMLTIKSGKDWLESQYDAIQDAMRSEYMGWKFANTHEGHQLLRVVLVATDAGPHVQGDSTLPTQNIGGCLHSDYPLPRDLGIEMNRNHIYPIFVVTSDIHSYWTGLAEELMIDAPDISATVLHLYQEPSYIFDSINDALENVCNINRRRLQAIGAM